MSHETYEELYMIMYDLKNDITLHNEYDDNYDEYAHDVCEYIQENYHNLKDESYDTMITYGRNKVNEFIKGK